MERERIIQQYIDGYNQFDLDKMFFNMAPNILFENIQNGKHTLRLSGLPALREQAEKAKTFFEERQQKIISCRHYRHKSEVKIDYCAVLAIDFPNGLKRGEKLQLTGKSVFYFNGDKIIRLTDIS